MRFVLPIVLLLAIGSIAAAHHWRCGPRTPRYYHPRWHEHPRVIVQAPYTDVRVNRRGVRVRAPFTSVDVPFRWRDHHSVVRGRRVCTPDGCYIEPAPPAVVAPAEIQDESPPPEQ